MLICRFLEGLNNTAKKMFDYLHERLDFLESKMGHTTRVPNHGFMSCILQVDIHQSGWRKAVLAILQSSQISHFEMDKGGLFRVYGIADLNELLKTLEKKGRRVTIKNLRHGQCSNNVYGPSLASYKAAPPGLKYPHNRPRLFDQELQDDETWPLRGEGTACCSLM